ncbi:MAG: esterase/lipase [Candidatus Azotimanducaceae bacterium]|jgi:esterase/lipase
MEALLAIVICAALLLLIFRFAPRPKLNPEPPMSHVPIDLIGEPLSDWLDQREGSIPHIIEGAGAQIQWANQPERTELCVLYIHGFSATRQEVAPVSERIAAEFGANVVYARLAGHGLSDHAMEASAEDWLHCVVDAWEIATRIGKRVVIVACSTGAPLSLWLNHHVADRNQIHSLIFMSPNIKIKNNFSFLLTWPWAPKWVPYLLGEQHEWEPQNELTRKFWTWRYSTLAIIEMQKMVDWVSQTRLNAADLPLATLYMKGDPTISVDAAVDFHKAWQASVKSLHQVEIDADNPQHVFAGAIAAPHRTDWCVDTCIAFVRRVNETSGV